jgi:hypothetical protein
MSYECVLTATSGLIRQPQHEQNFASPPATPFINLHPQEPSGIKAKKHRPSERRIASIIGKLSRLRFESRDSMS